MIEFNWQKVLVGVVSGAVSAFLIDLHAWSKAEGEFDWGLAFKRWVAGAVSGFMMALGLGGAQ